MLYRFIIDMPEFLMRQPHCNSIYGVRSTRIHEAMFALQTASIHDGFAVNSWRSQFINTLLYNKGKTEALSDQCLCSFFCDYAKIHKPRARGKLSLPAQGGGTRMRDEGRVRAVLIM